MNIELNQSQTPRELLFFFVSSELEKYKERNDKSWDSVALEIHNFSGISRKTVLRYVYFETRKDELLIPRVESAILILNAVYPNLTYEQILTKIPIGARRLIEKLRSHTNRDVTLSVEFDSLIQREPMTGLIFYMADTKLGVEKQAIKNKLGIYGLELTSKMIELGYLTQRHSRIYSTSLYPQLDIPAKTALISQLSNSGFKNSENSEHKVSLGLYRADLSKDNYEKARSILREAYLAIGKLDQEDSLNPEIPKINCVYFHGFNALEDVPTQFIH